MARGEEFEVRLTADNEITDEAEKAADALEAIPEKVEARIEMTGLDKAIGELDRLTQDAHATATAAEELGRALGPELAAKADLTAVVGELQKLGVEIEEITVNADQFAAKLREASDANIGGGLGQSLGTARGETEKLADSARGANSAMANMVGNTAQDLGALGGVVGSLGVGLGQMGEYAADAAFGGEKLSSALGSMAKVAGPIAALGVAVQGVSTYMEGINAEEAFREELVEGFADALREVDSAAQAVRDTIVEIVDETGELEFSEAGGGFIGLGRSAGDLLPILERLGIEFRDFVELTAEGGSAVEEALAGARDELKAMATGEQPWDTQRVADLKDYIAGLDQYAGSAEAAAERDRLRADALESVSDATVLSKDQVLDFAAALAAVGASDVRVDELTEQFVAVGEAAAEAEEAQRQMADAAQEYQTIASSSDWGRASIEGAAAGAERFAEAQFGLTNIASSAEAAYDALGKAVIDNGFTFDLNSEKGRANAAVLQDLYSTQIPAMAAAFANSDGDVAKFGASMDELRTNVMQQLREETFLTEDQIASVVAQMGLVPENVQSQFEMLGVEDANAKLALLSGVISSLPADVQRQVTLAVLAGDPQAALDTIEASVSGAPLPPAVVPVEADTGAAEGTVDDFTTETENTEPIVPVDSDTAAAMLTIGLLKVYAALQRPVVTVTADTLSAALSIAAVAGANYRATVNVGTSGLGDADRAINNVARDRTVTIRPNVVPTSVLVRVDGGG